MHDRNDVDSVVLHAVHDRGRETSKQRSSNFCLLHGPALRPLDEAIENGPNLKRQLPSEPALLALVELHTAARSSAKASGWKPTGFNG